MTARLENPLKLAPEGIKAMMAVEGALRKSGLEHGLLDLVKLRVSQINGCAFCLQMHATELRQHGESEMRLYMLNAWRESPLYGKRERAALAWAESLTRIEQTGAPDADYALVRAEFTDAEIVNLTLAIGAINLWKRLQIGLRAQPSEEAVAAVLRNAA